MSFAEDNRGHLHIYTQVFINIYKIFSKTQRLLFATQLGGGQKIYGGKQANANFYRISALEQVKHPLCALILHWDFELRTAQVWRVGGADAFETKEIELLPQAFLITF